MAATEDGDVVADGAPDLLRAVEDSVVDIVARSPRPPIAVRVSAGGVTVEAEWATATAAPGAVVEHGEPLGEQLREQGAAAAPAPAAAVSGRDDLTAVRSPSMGVLYRAPSPGAPPFVEVGDVVEVGQQLAVVESMKLFFPVNAESPGRVEAILKQDGEVVEHGEPVVVLEPAPAHG
jgi:acetyl-CoA carboxylase biotin carboxyl carrier protein